MTENGKKCCKHAETLDVKIVLLTHDAKIPTRAYSNDVGYDLYATANQIIPFGRSGTVPTGIAIQPPDGYYCTINARSSFGRSGRAVHRGIVDPGYRGELTVFIRNTSTDGAVKEDLVINKGDKIAQLTFHRGIYVEFTQVNTLDKTERGENGCGSSDKKS